MNETERKPSQREVESEATRIHKTIMGIFGGIDYDMSIEFCDMNKNTYLIRRSRLKRTWLETSMDTDMISVSVASSGFIGYTTKEMRTKLGENDGNNPRIEFRTGSLSLKIDAWHENPTRKELEESAQFTKELLSLIPQAYPQL